MHLDSQNIVGDPATAGRVQMVFVAEWVEVLMSLTGGKWNAGDSSGEGLSQYCSIVRFQTGHYNYYPSWVDQWLSQHPREDWVNSTEATDGNPISFGCALAFLYYLNVQMGFNITEIIAQGAANLATVYRNLTKDFGDPYPFFAKLLENVYPSSGTAAIPGPVSDNPFPIAFLSFWVNKDTFGADEVKDVLKLRRGDSTSGGVWPRAFWLIVEGFSANSFNALGVTPFWLNGSFANLAGVSITQRPLNEIVYENAVNPKAPQRIRIPFDIKFTEASLADFPTSGIRTYDLNASLATATSGIPGSDATTQFELVAGADPYFTNINPAQNNVFYLSQDLRVFNVVPSLDGAPVPGGPIFSNPYNAGTSDAYAYIQSLLVWLNDHYSNPLGADPFETLLPGQNDALHADSSVSPRIIVSPKQYPLALDNYSFAIARVRLRGSAGPAGAAQNVRVFFRLWCTETADTDFRAITTYRSTHNVGHANFPLVGDDHVTLPFFATGNSGNADYTPGGANMRTIQINTGDSAWAYFGCFLNLYDAGNLVDGKPVQAWLTGTHHCMVAELAFDGAPVINGASPEASDKLAQRNLQVTLSDNPGPHEAHRIPQTFDIRPSAAASPLVGAGALPDELMIDWGAIPSGSVASIYWPQVAASEVLALAAGLYSAHTLSAADSHTIQCKVTGGVTYIPIPAGGGENFAGLFTVDLPPTVTTGQEFNIVVRRIGTRQIRPENIRTHTPPSFPRATEGDETSRIAPRALVAALDAVPALKLKSWRYVVGTFQVKIPVSTGKEMLFAEENTLAILKWRLQQTAPASRWCPVLQRYISYLSARVDGFGGDSAAIQPSFNGVPIPSQEKAGSGEKRIGYVGKVSALVYDRFGDFEGFILDTEEGKRRFHAREPEIEKVVNRAWSGRILSTVYAEIDSPHRPEEIVLHCPPRPFT